MEEKYREHYVQAIKEALKIVEGFELDDTCRNILVGKVFDKIATPLVYLKEDKVPNETMESPVSLVARLEGDLSKWKDILNYKVEDTMITITKMKKLEMEEWREITDIIKKDYRGGWISDGMHSRWEIKK